MINRLEVISVLLVLGIAVAVETPCAEVTCPPLSFEIGSVTYDHDQQIGSTAHFTCPEHFFVDGAETSVCQANGQWSSATPTCSHVQCPMPVIDNGEVNYPDLYPGSEVTFSCHEHFELKGGATLKCGDDGVWSGSYPVCAPILCPVPSIANGEVTYTGVIPGSIADFKCNAGFELKGAAELKCGEDGDWSASYPVCVPILCPTPLIENGVVSYDGIKPGSIATFMCNDGFELKGPVEIKCGDNGYWSESYPVCVPILCPVPTIENGAVTYDTHPGSFADFSCNDGFVLKGDGHLTCGNDGDWSGSYPVCAPDRHFCPVLDVKNGEVAYSDDKRIPGSTATFTCPTGYVLQGPASAVCLASGQWDLTVVPECVIVTCPAFVLSNGFITYYPDTQPPIFGESVCLACQECGYTQVGGDRAWCQADGTWSAQPQCVPLDWGCTRTQGYWSTHPCVWPAPFAPVVSGRYCVCDVVKRLMIGTSLTYSECELLTVLALTGGDALRILAAQLIAAKLNLLKGVITCFPIVSLDPTNPYNGLTVVDLIAKADALIGGTSLFTLQIVDPSSELGQKMLWVKTLLALFNQGEATVPHCV